MSKDCTSFCSRLSLTMVVFAFLVLSIYEQFGWDTLSYRFSVSSFAHSTRSVAKCVYSQYGSMHEAHVGDVFTIPFGDDLILSSNSTATVTFSELTNSQFQFSWISHGFWFSFGRSYNFSITESESLPLLVENIEISGHLAPLLQLVEYLTGEQFYNGYEIQLQFLGKCLENEFEQQAKQGNAEALYTLGLSYSLHRFTILNNGVAKPQCTKAKQAFTKAASKGHKKAQLILQRFDEGQSSCGFYSNLNQSQ